MASGTRPGEPLPRIVISPYVKPHVLRTLGVGGFGRVVLARYLGPGDEGLERSEDLALKYADRSRGARRKNILWEAACLREVAHAHVIKLLDVCASSLGGEKNPSDLPTLVFPPADTDLGTFIHRTGGLPTALARRMMGQLASALAHVHSHGIIHRDLKPGNCLIFLAAEVHEEFLGPSLALADFGMARRVSASEGTRRCLNALQKVQPMTAKVCTAWYRPPELWACTMDDHDVDAGTDDERPAEPSTPYGSSLDVWSFGAVVYEALTGENLARRARNGAAMAQALADVIGACPAQGAGAVEYARNEQWKSWAAARPAGLAPSRPLPDSGAEWDLVRACLRWDPSARETMASAKQCAWFVERVAAPGAAPTVQSERLDVLDAKHRGACAGASTLSTKVPTSLTGSETQSESQRLRGACAGASTPNSLQASRERVLAWIHTDTSMSEAKSETPCSCKGHCRHWQHRKEGKCDCTQLVIGTLYCKTCLCSVAGCCRPRNKSDYCYHHKTTVENATFRVQLAVAAVPLAHLLVPCDVVDFLSHSAFLQDDLAMLILTAAIKEPLVVGALVEAWRQLPKMYSGSDLRSALLSAVAAADGAPHVAQLDQLHRQGVGRFFGLITTAQNLGIIEKKNSEIDGVAMPAPRCPAKEKTVAKAAAKAQDVAQQPQAKEYRLGKQRTAYVVLDPSASKCDAFLEATRAEERFLATPADATPGASTPCALDDLVDYGTRRAEQALRRIGNKSGALPFSVKDASGYCIDFLRRKLVAARLFQQDLHQRGSADWSAVDKPSLQGMSADAKENLEEIPNTWMAHEISSFFTGRTDWGLFASVFPCLWGEVADKLTKRDRSRALEAVKSQEFLRVVERFHRNEGIAPHPAVAFKIWESDHGQEQAKRANLRASTPRPQKRATAMETPRASSPRKAKKRKAQPKA